MDGDELSCSFNVICLEIFVVLGFLGVDTDFSKRVISFQYKKTQTVQNPTNERLFYKWIAPNATRKCTVPHDFGNSNLYLPSRVWTSFTLNWNKCCTKTSRSNRVYFFSGPYGLLSMLFIYKHLSYPGF